MFSSLPPLALHDAHTLWYPSFSAHSHPPPPSSTAVNGSHHYANNPQQNRNAHPTPPLRTVLTTLRNDENALSIRKANIRRFGAGWLKPPGVSKTLQGILDEAAEREEQEAVAAREMALLEAQAAAEEAEALDDPEAGASERDLDDEIPDADQEENPDLDDGQEAWEDEDGDDALPTEEGDGDYAGEDGEGDTEGRDLDDEVPEGGSYQHTDTDVEDESSEDGGGGARESLPVGVARGGGLASSVFGSSPVVQPRVAGRRSGGLQGRRQGRENSRA